MSSRATYYRRRDGQGQIASSKWGALDIDRMLLHGPHGLDYFFDSPDGSAAYFDEVFCEGGFFLDEDARRLRMFGGDFIGYIPSLRPTYLGLLQLSWPGWDVDWAYDGILELDDLYYGRSRTFADLPDDSSGPDAAEWIPSDLLAEREPLLDPTLGDGADVVLVNIMDDTGVDDHLVPCTDIASLLGVGPALERALGERFLNGLPTEEDDLLLRGGAVVEPERRCLTVWMAKPLWSDFKRLARRWPKWTLQRQDEGLLHQIRQIGCDPARHRIEPATAVTQILAKLDRKGFFWGDPAVQEILGGVAEPDRAQKLAEHIRPVAARAPRILVP